MHVFFLFVLALFSPDIQAFSKSPYHDGKVGIKVINNTPCAYIDKAQLRGWYVMRIYSKDEKGNSQSWPYYNSFEKHYPIENQCILLNASNFQNLKLKENIPYTINLISDKGKYTEPPPYPGFDGFQSKICLTRNQDRQLVIQDYIYGKCMDREPEMPKAPIPDADSDSWFSGLLNWFKGLW